MFAIVGLFSAMAQDFGYLLQYFMTSQGGGSQFWSLSFERFIGAHASGFELQTLA
jgi:hypothetical protein